MYKGHNQDIVCTNESCFAPVPRQDFNFHQIIVVMVYVLSVLRFAMCIDLVGNR